MMNETMVKWKSIVKGTIEQANGALLIISLFWVVVLLAVLLLDILLNFSDDIYIVFVLTGIVLIGAFINSIYQNFSC